MKNLFLLMFFCVCFNFAFAEEEDHVELLYDDENGGYVVKAEEGVLLPVYFRIQNCFLSEEDEERAFDEEPFLSMLRSPFDGYFRVRDNQLQHSLDNNEWKRFWDDMPWDTPSKNKLKMNWEVTAINSQFMLLGTLDLKGYPEDCKKFLSMFNVNNGYATHFKNPVGEDIFEVKKGDKLPLQLRFVGCVDEDFREDEDIEIIYLNIKATDDTYIKVEDGDILTTDIDVVNWKKLLESASLSLPFERDVPIEWNLWKDEYGLTIEGIINLTDYEGGCKQMREHFHGKEENATKAETTEDVLNEL